MTFVQDDEVVIDRESISQNLERYKEVGRPFDKLPDLCYDGIVGIVYHPINLPFSGYLVDFGDQGMMPMFPWEIKKWESDGKDTD